MRNTLLVLLFSGSWISFGQDFWTQKDSIKGPPRSALASFVLGNRGYVVGGLIGNESSRKMYSYSQNQDDWDDEISLGDSLGGGLERHLACGFSIDNLGYITTGQGLGTPFMKDLWEFDKGAQSWTQKADFPSTARRAAVNFVVNGLAYVGTGEDPQGMCSDFYQYNPALNVWNAISPFPGGGRKQAVAFELNGYGWIATGDDGVLKNDLWSYNTVTDLWQQKADLPGPARAGAVAWSTSPSAYVATGQSAQGEFLADVWQYNYYQNAWVQKNEFSGGPRANACAFVINGTPYIGGGYNGQFLDDFYAYYGLAGTLEEEVAPSELFPNPTLGLLEYQGFEVPIRYEVYSMEGRILQQGLLLEDRIINLEHLPVGSYWVSLFFSHTKTVKCIQKR
ncbi:MAG: hypothetical protein ACKO4K_02670 [Flavobacteriales bacterium]